METRPGAVPNKRPLRAFVSSTPLRGLLLYPQINGPYRLSIKRATTKHVMNIAPKRTSGPIGGKTGLNAKLYPNGEVVVYKPRTFKMEPMAKPHQYDEAGLFCACMRAYGTVAPALLAGLLPLGLSPLPIFDSNPEASVLAPGKIAAARGIKGQKGITSYGARIVRNCAHLLESSVQVGRCIFATVTVPNLPIQAIGAIHENWNQVVELYRLSLRRALQRKGLSGESVTVSEIQEKRHQRTGLPVLHLHSVFVGVTASGKFAIAPKEHDRMWYAALSSVVDIDWSDITSACNLQRVKKSAAGYLGKYMSKGSKAVITARANGFERWLPKHWWNASRSLTRRVKANTRRIDYLADWLNEIAEVKGNGVWEWHRDVQIEMYNGDKINIARYGRLTKGFNEQLHQLITDP